MKFGYLVVIYDLVDSAVYKIYFFSSYSKARSFLKNYVKNYNRDNRFYSMTYDYKNHYSSRFNSITIINLEKEGCNILHFDGRF